MKTSSGALQLRLIGEETIEQKIDHTDLINRRFDDGLSLIRVVSLCRTDAAQVIVERERDGKRWSISAGVVRMIVGRARNKRRA